MQVLQSQRYSEPADVFSYGIVLWELLTRQMPYKGLTAPQVAMEVSKGGRPPVPPPSAEAPASWLALMRQCWADEPAQRPTFRAVLLALVALQRELAAAPAQAQAQPVARAPPPSTPPPGAAGAQSAAAGGEQAAGRAACSSGEPFIGV